MPHFIKCIGEPEAHYNLAYIMYQQGRVDVAERHLVECLDKKPKLKQAQTLLTELREMRKDREAIAGAPAASSNVAPASHTVRSGPRQTTPAPVPASQIDTRPGQGELPNWSTHAFSAQSSQIAAQPRQRPVTVSQPQAAANTPYYSAPNAPVQRPATQAATPEDHIEQWNHKTGVW
jgi:hypothetical protein